MNIEEYIASGILEMYISGLTSSDESEEVVRLAALYPEIKKELEAIDFALEKYTELNRVTPHPSIKPFLMAKLDYIKRLESGEVQTFPSELSSNSKIEDYSQWLNREDMQLPADFEEVHAKIIGATPQMTSAIVWIKTMAPEETHSDEHEKFFILEGTCDIIVGKDKHSLKVGDYFAIPLHADHHVIVTSSSPCKVILQRVAA